MNKVKKNLIVQVLAIIALGLFASTIVKAEINPFAAGDLVTTATEHSKNKCGEGKCGEGKMKATKKSKCGEGKCGEGKMKEHSKKCGG